jgi:hypothetical protein
MQSFRVDDASILGLVSLDGIPQAALLVQESALDQVAPQGRRLP